MKGSYLLEVGGVYLKIKEGLVVTNVRLDEYELPIPEGFSDFLLKTGFWSYEGSAPVKKEMSNYNRKVVLEDGTLCTYLTFKRETSQKLKSGKKEVS